MPLGELFYRYWRVVSYSQGHLCTHTYFFFFCVVEQFYKICFCFHRLFCSFLCVSYKSSFSVCSVGNISSGGVGKSVFTRYIISLMNHYRGAIITRGYKGEFEKKNKNALLFDGKNIYLDVKESGDEAMMYASMLSVPIMIGKNRTISAQNLSGIDYAVLDDAYQNNSLYKDCEILLLDARAPFDNNHCLPAGLLREKDLTRANIIILTHADTITSSLLSSIKKDIKSKGFRGFIGAGKHKQSAFINANFETIDNFNKRELLGAFAGVGSFPGFLHTLTKAQLSIDFVKEFSNHYIYTKIDVQAIYSFAQERGVSVCITTIKDLVKVGPIWPSSGPISLCAVDVCFEFLKKKDEIIFIKILKKTLRLAR